MNKKITLLKIFFGLTILILSNTLFAASSEQDQSKLTPVTLQLLRIPQMEYAGYYVAKEKGYYQDEGLSVTIKPGCSTITSCSVLNEGKADFAIAGLAKIATTPALQANLVNIAQIFQRSSTLEIAWKDSNITKPEDWRGKKIGTWGNGSELELYAAMRKAKIDPNNKNDVTIVNQPEDLSLFVKRKIDAAQALSYDDYYQLLQMTDPKTGKRYKTSDLKVIDFNDVGTAMLQDGLYARKAWLKDPGNADTATKFLRGSFRGWIYCRDHVGECVDIMAKYSPKRDKAFLTWQLNEVNELIWPAPQGIGILDPNAFSQTVKILRDAKLINKDPGNDVYRTDLAKKALEK